MTTPDGRRVRRGRLFRMDDPVGVSAADLEILRTLGVRNVVDLRNDEEEGARGSAAWSELNVRQVRCSIMNFTPPVADYPRFIEPEFCAREYARYIDEPDVARTLWRALAELTIEPTAIHCASGRDRTGVVAAMVLEAVGVQREQVIHDYSLSATGMVRLLDYLETHLPDRAPNGDAHRRSFLATPPECMAAFLDVVDARWGGVAGYLAEHGLEAEAERLRTNLLKD